MISLRHKGPLSHGLEDMNGIDHPNIAQGVGVLSNVVIYTISLWVGEVIDSSPFRWLVFFLRVTHTD